MATVVPSATLLSITAGIISSRKTYTYSVAQPGDPNGTILTDGDLNGAIGWNIGTSGGTFVVDVTVDLVNTSSFVNFATIWYGTAFAQPNYTPDIVEIQTSPDNVTYTSRATTGTLGVPLPGRSTTIKFTGVTARYVRFHISKLEASLHDWLFFNEVQTGGPLSTRFTQHPSRSLITIVAKNPNRVGITKIYPTSTTIHLSARSPKLNRTQKPSASAIHFSARNPTILNIMTIHPSRTTINLLANGIKSILTQHPSRSVIHLSANSIRTNQTIHPTSASIHLLARGVKTNQTIYPTRSVINLSAKSIKANLTQHPSRSVIHLSANSIRTNQTIRPTHLTIHLLAQAPAKINRVQKPSSSAIHMAVSPPTNRLTQHVSRAVIHLALPPPKLMLISKPIRTIIHLNVPAPMVIFNQVAHPAHTTIAISARNPIVSTAFIRYKFTVKIRRNVNFIVKIPDHHP